MHDWSAAELRSDDSELSSQASELSSEVSELSSAASELSSVPQSLAFLRESMIWAPPCGQSAHFPGGVGATGGAQVQSPLRVSSVFVGGDWCFVHVRGRLAEQPTT
jgi:hypothetical protein